ncbi:MAG: exopolyphosphatase [Propionibacteriaceae bacterium]|jgi:exopolyphosphatase/guanosine-5'-triphosphate,3'-diphosphate pyrophosphatase|nr:exopolyphosphatase [Propionibacteriaceae bacterium]
MRVAVIDCGTNTARLYIAHQGDDGQLIDEQRLIRFVRLGQGVDATGAFAPEALQRLFDCCDEFKAIIDRSQVDRTRFIATSAARDVSNRRAFEQGVAQHLGVPAEVISGDEEARLSFAGAVLGGALPGTMSLLGSAGTAQTDAVAPLLVTDLGGGSTELTRGDALGRVKADVSLNMGSVRLRERFLHHDPPLADEVAAARSFIAELLDGQGDSLTKLNCWIGVAGTCTSLAAIHLGLATYDRMAVHNSWLPITSIDALTNRLLTLTVAQSLEAYPLLQPARAQVIVAGALILQALAQRIGLDLLVRDSDILDGAAAKLVSDQ